MSGAWATTSLFCSVPQFWNHLPPMVLLNGGQDDSGSLLSVPSSRPVTPPTSLLARPKTFRNIPNNGCFNGFATKKNLDAASPREWMKVLYLKQGVPDNFVPASFLHDLRTNVNLEKYQLADIILATGALTQQVTSIVILISMFMFLDTFGHSTSIVSVLYTLITLITLFLYLSTIFILPKNNVMTEIKSTTIFLVTGFAMSPILRTLTETVSTDTIYAMVTLMMLAHLSFYNYGVNAAIVSKPISLNAAFFASVCLASRLSTSYHAFAFLIFAIDIFVLFGILYTKLPNIAKTVMTILFSITSLVMMNFIFSTLHCGLFLFLIFFINIACPIGFFKMQAYKENIYGPWDEAIINPSNFLYFNLSQATSPTSPTSPTLISNGSSSKFLRSNSTTTALVNDIWAKMKTK